MVTLNLSDVEQIIEKYMPQFNNNQSEFIRQSIQFYDQHQTKEKEKINKQLLFQFSLFLLLGIGLIIFALSMYITILLFIVPVILIISGSSFIVFSIIIGKKTIGKFQGG